MEMDKDIIDFNAINIKTKTIPFKTQNDVLSKKKTIPSGSLKFLIIFLYCRMVCIGRLYYEKDHDCHLRFSRTQFCRGRTLCLQPIRQLRFGNQRRKTFERCLEKQPHCLWQCKLHQQFPDSAVHKRDG